MRLTLVGTELMKLFLRLMTESVEPLFGVRLLFSWCKNLLPKEGLRFDEGDDKIA